MKSKRNSSIELLRIFGLFLIVLGHFAWQTNWNFNDSSWLLESMVHCFWIGGKLGVNLFVLISGYFLINSSFKSKAFIKTWLISYFYGLVIYFSALVFHINSFNFKDLIKTIFLAQTGYLNWFVTAYLILCIASPFLNIFLKSLSRYQYNVLLVVLLILATIRTIFHNPSIGTTGNDGVWLIVVYIFGAYIKLFEVSIKQIRINLYVYLLILSILLSMISVFSLDALQKFFHIASSNSRFYGQFIDGFSPLQLISAVCIFILFLNMRAFTNGFINRIASTTFAVYLIHANLLIMNWLWNKVVCGFKFQSSYLVLGYGLLISVLIFLICSVIDLLRQLIFGNVERKIVNKIAKLKFWSLIESVNR